MDVKGKRHTAVTHRWGQAKQVRREVNRAGSHGGDNVRLGLEGWGCFKYRQTDFSFTLC